MLYVGIFIILFALIGIFGAARLEWKIGLHNWCLIIVILSFMLLMCGIWLTSTSIHVRDVELDYTPITVIVGDEKYTGKWHPDEQEEFVVYKNDDFTKCIVGRIYNVGYGPWDEGD